MSSAQICLLWGAGWDSNPQPYLCCPGILPLPLRKVMQEKNEAGSGWIEKDTRGEATGRACLPLPRSRAFWLWTKVEKALAHGRDQGIPRPLLKERGKTRSGSRCCGAWTGVLDEPSVAFFTHEPHP